MGDDPQFNVLADECYDGDMQSCDDLYNGTLDDSSLSAYTLYGDTCAGRQDQGTRKLCTDTFPGG